MIFSFFSDAALTAAAGDMSEEFVSESDPQAAVPPARSATTNAPAAALDFLLLCIPHP
ncbi:hypothetical protein ACFWIA_03285 [Streptomyces sp. NPDC127068]|uniref:hypothetical protein n=1 Tax=Streptomyces sp. NPDC127068 TaxID=3347127 RepID=UPI0036478BF4